MTVGMSHAVATWPGSLRPCGLPALSLACTLGVAAPVVAQGRGEPSLIREVLGDGIYLFRAPSAMDLWTATNVVVIVNERDVVVFDSNARPSTTRRVIAEIRRLTDKPVRELINSHWHMNHWSGNAEYAKAFPGLEIIATTESRDYMKRMGAGFFAPEIDHEIVQDAKAALDSAKGDARHSAQQDFDAAMQFEQEMAATPRVLPNLAYRDTLIFWSGTREFRLFRETGDASGSTVLYLPRERLLVTGDVLVSPEDGKGPPPWTTNSNAVTPWLESLKSLNELDVGTVVPGQGPAMHDKRYLTLTNDLFDAVLSQVHHALEHGVVTLADVKQAVNVDSIAARYVPKSPLPAYWRPWLEVFIGKVYVESLDGARVDKKADLLH
jgi:cyclase